jgi:branched-subunit amino acid transport protein
MYNMQQLILYCSIVELLFAIPAGMVLKRMGFSSWWALLCFVPVVALFALWLLAFVKWPKDAAAQV